MRCPVDAGDSGALGRGDGIPTVGLRACSCRSCAVVPSSRRSSRDIFLQAARTHASASGPPARNERGHEAQERERDRKSQSTQVSLSLSLYFCRVGFGVSCEKMHRIPCSTDLSADWGRSDKGGAGATRSSVGNHLVNPATSRLLLCASRAAYSTALACSYFPSPRCRHRFFPSCSPRNRKVARILALAR